MNEQKIKELVVGIKFGYHQPKKIKPDDSCFTAEWWHAKAWDAATAIEQLQTELIAKDERIKELDEFKQFAIDSVDTDETGLGEFGRGEESARFELYQMFTTWELVK